MVTCHDAITNIGCMFLSSFFCSAGLVVTCHDAITNIGYMYPSSFFCSAGLVVTCHDATRFPKLAGIDSEGRALSLSETEDREGSRYAAGTHVNRLFRGV